MTERMLTRQDVLGPTARQLGSVLPSWQQALGAMSGIVPNPQFAGALDFLAGSLAGSSSDVEERLYNHEAQIHRLVSHTRNLVAESAEKTGKKS
jgi:hypothetical protein